ncbi:MAG TPA: IclR family transcriptional regulator [Ktedonobacterales bacterium]|jgi:DNA-binding IclR family transcriptional regulator
MRHGESNGTVQTVRRVASVFSAFQSRGLLRITELAELTSLPKSTVHRIVSALVAEGLLVQDEDSHKYQLSLRVAELGAGLLSTNSVRRAARPILMDLRDKTHESVHLAVLEHLDVVIIDTEDSYYFVREVNVPGQHLPAHAVSTGKVLLAYQWEGHLREMLAQMPLKRYTEQTITDPRRLLEELRQVRARGYAISCGELEVGVEAVAAPIFDQTGTIAAAVSVGGPSERCHPRQTEFVRAVCEAGQRITQAMRLSGWR